MDKLIIEEIRGYNHNKSYHQSCFPGIRWEARYVYQIHPDYMFDRPTLCAGCGRSVRENPPEKKEATK